MNLNVHKIKVLMARQGLTSTKLANNAGMSRQNISTILRRGTALPITVGHIAKALGVDPAEIIVEGG